MAVSISDVINTTDLDGTATASDKLRLKATGVTAGAYTSANVTVDAKGRITAIENGGGGTATVVAKTADFIADGDSGTIYTNEGAAGTITGTLSDAPIGTEYEFYVLENESLVVSFPDGHNVRGFAFFDGANPSFGTSLGSVGSSTIGHSLKVKKITATDWELISYGFSD